MKASHVEFIGIYDDALPREHFLQHIPEMVHVKFTGNTFGDLSKAIDEKFKDDERLPLFQDFINFNREGSEEQEGAKDSDQLFEGSADEKSIAHFSLHFEK